MRENWENVARFPSELRNISLPQRLRAPPQVLIQWVPGLLARCEAGHSPSSSGEVKNVWSRNSILHTPREKFFLNVGLHGIIDI